MEELTFGCLFAVQKWYLVFCRKYMNIPFVYGFGAVLPGACKFVKLKGGYARDCPLFG